MMKTDTVIAWNRKEFRLCWIWKIEGPRDDHLNPTKRETALVLVSTHEQRHDKSTDGIFASERDSAAHHRSNNCLLDKVRLGKRSPALLNLRKMGERH